MKKLVFSAMAVFAFSSISSASTIADEKDSYLKSELSIVESNDLDQPPIGCNISIVLVDENGEAIGEMNYKVNTPMNFIDCLNRGLLEAKNLNDQGIATGKVMVLSYHV